MADLTQTTFDVSVGADTFIFKVPSVREYARLGIRSRELRRADSPTGTGDEWGLDGTTADLYRGMALFETLLQKADARDNWPYSTDDSGKPSVDSSKFPPQATQSVILAYQWFETQYQRFLGDWSANR